MIYGRFGDEVVILRGDIKRGVAQIRYNDDGTEIEANLSYLRADGGIAEIFAAIEAANARNAHEAAQATTESDRDL